VSTVREALDSGYKVKVGQGQIDGHHEEAPPVPLQDGESVLVEPVVQEQYELGGTRSETEVSVVLAPSIESKLMVLRR
jgi:hypothetical protein